MLRSDGMKNGRSPSENILYFVDPEDHKMKS
jgi:hypothetical protein